MMPGVNGRGWLLAAGSAGSALLALAAAAALLVYAALASTPRAVPPQAPGPFQAIVLAAALTLVGALCTLAAFHSIRALSGRGGSGTRPKPLLIWQGAILILFWIGAALAAQSLVNREAWKWLSTLFYLLAVGLPVYLLVRLAGGGLDAGSPRRFWGLLTIGMLFSTGIAVTFELLLGLVGLIFAGIYLAVNPEQIAALQQLTAQLSGVSNMEQMISAIGPWLNRPIVFALAMVFFAGVSPVLEEGSKSLGAWLIYDRLHTASQGFVAGALAGAGFGLLESLLASATPDPHWGSTLVVRGGSSMMHVVASGIAGWGIGSFRSSGRPARLVGGYLLAMLIHSLWNASVLSLAFGGINAAVNGGRPSPLALVLVVGGSLTLAGLCISIPVALGLINWRLRFLAARPAEG